MGGASGFFFFFFNCNRMQHQVLFKEMTEGGGVETTGCLAFTANYSLHLETLAKEKLVPEKVPEKDSLLGLIKAESIYFQVRKEQSMAGSRVSLPSNQIWVADAVSSVQL